MIYEVKLYGDLLDKDLTVAIDAESESVALDIAMKHISNVTRAEVVKIYDVSQEEYIECYQ